MKRLELRAAGRESKPRSYESCRSLRTRSSRLASGSRGFTLMELMVVISLMLILLAIALPMYTAAVTHAREAKLKQNLSTLREIIEKYSLDKGHAPQSGDDLVQAGYVKMIPEDITGSAETWHWEQEDDPEKAWDPNQFGITDVHSGSNDQSTDGRPYSEW